MTSEFVPVHSLTDLTPTRVQDAVDVLLYSLSDSSRRVYAHTYRQWRDFAHEHDLPDYDLRPQNLIAFLDSCDLAHRTKQARLSHLRRLLQALHAAYPHIVALQSMYEQAKLLKVTRSREDTDSERTKQSLTRQQVYQAFAVWSDDRALHKRNRALLAILFYGGLRRSEAAVLRWEDIDLDAALLRVRHGKGDKDRTIPLLGGETPLDMLREWRACIPERTYVFCGMRKGDTLLADAPMSDKAVYRVIKATSAALGTDFAPHDARRTLLTHLLNAGTSVADAQFIAGHADPQTTLNYAVIKDANEVKGRAKLDY